jgi:hypothetical protein
MKQQYTNPLFIVLILSFNVEPGVVSVPDCIKHSEKGEKMDTKYVADVFFPHTRKLYPVKEKFDLFIADGASNAQTAGAIINAHFPRITTVHGSEHGISLVFSDIAKKTEIKVSFAVISD